MCVILFSYQPNTSTPLVLGANRDEFFKRPTAAAQFWDDKPNILAGRDLQAGGTWLGITQSGRFAAITNVREPGVVVENPRSRGELTKDYLMGSQTPLSYLESILKHQDRYAGFNLLVGEFSALNSSTTGNHLYYLSNRGEGIQELSSGTYGLSNHLLDSPWPKVIDGKAELRSRLQEAGTDHGQIRQILENPALADDHRLPETGVDYEREKALSAMFIALPDYGTRTSTVLTMNKGQILFSEQNYHASSDGQPCLDGKPSIFKIDDSQQKAS
ncbi:MAG: NRDE family protein [Cellvibrionaceae bacterium]